MARRELTNRTRTFSCERKENDFTPVTKPGLSMSPAQVKSLTDRGMAVSTPNLSYYDGDPVPDWNIPLEFKRGTTMEDAWETSKVSNNKVLTAYRRDKKTYGK